jgi:hypothetical protein
MPHVQLPPSFSSELQEVMLPIAAKMSPPANVVEWADLWGFGPEAKRALLERHLRPLSGGDSSTEAAPSEAPSDVSTASTRKGVSFGCDTAVDVHFFSVDAAPSASSVYESTTTVKCFDGKSGHKMIRCVGGALREGGEEDWEEIAQLMSTPRAAVCWSPTWA